MAVLDKLSELGFVTASESGTSRGVKTYRIRTANGWVYERFANDEAVQEWAKYHKPEEAK